MPQITYCCCQEARLFDYPSGDIVYQTAPQATAAFRRSCFRLPLTILNSAAGSLYILPFATSYVFVYDDNYAGQTSIRAHRRVMDLRAGLDDGGAGNTLAVLSSPRRPKMCVKPRSTACPHSACPAEKIRVRSGGGPDGANVILPPRRTYRVGAADISLLRGSNVRLSYYHICAKSCAECLLFCSCGVYRGAAARCPRKNIVSEAAEHRLRLLYLFGGAGHIRSAAPRCLRQTHHLCVFTVFIDAINLLRIVPQAFLTSFCSSSVNAPIRVNISSQYSLS